MVIMGYSGLLWVIPGYYEVLSHPFQVHWKAELSWLVYDDQKQKMTYAMPEMSIVLALHVKHQGGLTVSFITVYDLTKKKLDLNTLQPYQIGLLVLYEMH